MAISNDPHIEGFVDVVRLSWLVYLLLTLDERTAKDAISGASTSDLTSIEACLDRISSNNIFEFILGNILRTVAFQVCFYVFEVFMNLFLCMYFCSLDEYYQFKLCRCSCIDGSKSRQRGVGVMKGI